MAEQKETAAQIIERLTAELAAANKALESFQAQAAQASADEILIREKLLRGLTREQALAVIKRQRAHDQLVKEQSEAAAKSAKAELKKP